MLAANAGTPSFAPNVAVKPAVETYLFASRTSRVAPLSKLASNAASVTNDGVTRTDPAFLLATVVTVILASVVLATIAVSVNEPYSSILLETPSFIQQLYHLVFCIDQQVRSQGLVLRWCYEFDKSFYRLG